VKSGETVSEVFPVGTKLFKGGKIITLKKPLYVVTEEQSNFYNRAIEQRRQVTACVFLFEFEPTACVKNTVPS
jgi:hypothetical protein